MLVLKNLLQMIIIFLASISFTVNACTVDEVVEMVSNGAGHRAIEGQCERVVDGAPNCNLRRVISLAQAGMDENDIDDRCGLCDMPVCSTQWGTCVITHITGQFVKSGQCSCQMPGGFVPGTAQCNN